MKFTKKHDKLIIFTITALSVLYMIAYSYFFKNRSSRVEIYYKSELVEAFDLTTGTDKTFRVEQNKDVVFHLFEDGSISFEESDCPDKICINTGRINKIGESAACLPNDLVLKIIPSGEYKKDDHDIIVGR